MKEFVCFSRTDVFVPVSQLSTRDLFDFLGNLKIKQDIFFLSWISRRVRSVEQRALWYSYSRLFFGIVFWVFYKVNCGVHLGFLAHLSEKMFYLLTCKKNHNFLNLGWHVENVFCLKDFVTWLSVVFSLRFFLFYFWREKNLGPDFGVMVFFLDLVDF